MESNGNMIAPFVLKTYQILSDPTSNRLIAWGRANNSFIVLEPSDFSQRILPLYFNHSNFSSFVRQLYTYGFRKVDPDRWEFANEWFLRGQTHLLNKIVRRKNNTSLIIKHEEEEDGDDDDDELVMEVAKLRHEQASIEEDLRSMSLRLQTRERRPQQIMTFLCKVAEDPQILPQIMLNKQNVRHLAYDSSNKERETIMVSAAASSSSSSAVPMHHSYATDLSSSSIVGSSGGGAAAPPVNSGGGVCSSYFEALVAGEMAEQQPAPYPFSLLDGGF